LIQIIVPGFETCSLEPICNGEETERVRTMSKDAEYFRKKLLALKKEAEERLQAIERDMRHEEAPKDWEDRASETENDETLESLAQLTQRELMQINEALTRIDEGDYFTCNECGAPIPEERLELLPYTTLCVNCAEALERQQRSGML
jgi:RNA polymerase-binding protein DksA